ncbi:hypothetical protein, partial [Klebsiella oxytoca]|uniref:hypothetical protein n=1 Tax=Klebsiella oxytoca TaxID=571 RepID=UPI00195364BE
GYDIARDRRKISCGEIVRAVASQGDDESEGMTLLVSTVIEPAIAEAESRFYAALDRISIAELCASAEGQSRPTLALA